MGAVGHTFSDFSCFVTLRNMMIFWASLLELKVDDGTGGDAGGGGDLECVRGARKTSTIQY